MCDTAADGHAAGQPSRQGHPEAGAGLMCLRNSESGWEGGDTVEGNEAREWESQGVASDSHLNRIPGLLG